MRKFSPWLAENKLCFQWTDKLFKALWGSNRCWIRGSCV